MTQNNDYFVHRLIHRWPYGRTDRLIPVYPLKHSKTAKLKFSHTYQFHITIQDIKVLNTLFTMIHYFFIQHVQQVFKNSVQ